MSQSPTFEYKDAKTPGESSDSIKLLERALELTQIAVGPDDAAVGVLANRLGERYHDAGNYGRALALYEQSLAIAEKALGPDHPDVGDCLNDLASLHADLQNYDEAIRLYQRSLAITEKAYGPEHPEVATTLANMATTYRDKSDYAQALRVGQRSLQIREKALGPGHPDVADSLCTLADVHMELGDSARALRLAERALAITKKSLPPDHPLVADCLSTLAEIQKCRRSFGEAEVTERRALAINEKVSGPEHPDVFRNLSSLAQLYAIAGDSEHSISSFGELFRRQRRYLARHFQTSSWMVASRVAGALRTSSEMFQTLCGTAPTNATRTFRAGAAEHLALSKAFWEEVQAAHAAVEADQRTTTAELRDQYRSLQAQLARLPGSGLDEAKRDARRLEVEAELRKVEARLAQHVGLVAQRVLEQEVQLMVIAGELPTRAVLVDVVEYRRFDFTARTNQWKENRYAAYLTFPLAKDSTNVVLERVDLGEAAPIDAAVETISKRMLAGQFAAKDLPAALQRLSELVYGPLAEHLTKISHLIVCPDGQLNRVPFEMLSHNGRFLVEDKTVSYVGSGREIVRLALGASQKAKAQSSRSLVIGNPDFDLELGAAREPHSLVASRSLSGDYRGIKFLPLPQAEAEARSVAKLLGGDCVLRLGAEAREAEVKAVRSPRVLHLATHGFFLSDQEFKRTNSAALDSLSAPVGWPQHRAANDWENPLVRCGIALAGANHAQQITNALAEDGLLTGLEAALLNLQGTELVILSACDSGIGEVKNGEGVMSLRRAFRIAGAETVLASHWKVSDQATSLLMAEFMRRWRAGEPRAKAWREAQLQLLHSTEFANPYFWAAFTLTGQWN